MNWFISEEMLKLVEQISPLCSLLKCDDSPWRSLGLKEGSSLDTLFKKNTLGIETKTILIQLVHNTTPEKVLITTDAGLKPPQG